MDVAILKELIRSPVSAGTLDPTDLAAVAGMSPQGVPQGLGGGTNVQVSQDRDPATVVRVRVLVRRGRTWADGGPRPSATWWPSGRAQSRSATGSYVTFGDPGLDEDGQGTFSFANLALWEDDAAVPSAGVVIYRGGFYGSEFARDRPVLIQSPNYPNDSLDKEALVVDRRGGRTQTCMSRSLTSRRPATSPAAGSASSRCSAHTTAGRAGPGPSSSPTRPS